MQKGNQRCQRQFGYFSVDLQTKTATFQTGLADAAKAARGSFNDIKSGAGEMGGSVNYSMMEARHSVMLLGEEFGVHLPRALTSFIASIGPLGGALEAAFPFLAIAVGATLLIEHLAKMHAAGEKLTDDQMAFGTAAQNAFNSLDERLIQAQIKADELKTDHLGALQLALELIDKQSLQELANQFDNVAKHADVVMKSLSGAWYTFGIGSDGASHALQQFGTQYESLLSKGKDDQAHGLLTGTLAQARKVRAALDGIKTYQYSATGGDNSHANYAKYEEARNTLKAAGLAGTQKEIEAQDTLITALQTQLGIEQRLSALKNIDKGNANSETGKKMADEAAEAQRKQEEAMHKALDAVSEQNQAQIAASEQRVKAIEEDQKNAIARTIAGTQQRLDVIRGFIEQDESLGLDDTAQYRSLLEQRNQLAKELDEQNAKQRLQTAEDSFKSIEDALKETLKNQQAQSQLKMKGGEPSELANLAQIRAALDAEYAAKKEAYAKEAAAYSAAGLEQTKEAQSVHRQMLTADQEYADQKKQLQDKEAADTRATLLQMQNQYIDTFARVAFGRESLGRVMEQMAQQDITNTLKAVLTTMEGEKSQQLAAAKAAAAKAMSAVSQIPVVGPAMAPIAGAAVFAGAMAFNSGTDAVPGVGRGDVVPSMLEPGEGVVPGGVMDGLRSMARNGGFQQQHVTHIHVRPTYNLQALDGDGIGAVLDKHQETLTHHFNQAVRRMNR
ncbi:coiled-coil domain-containing protein [Terracidiphilus gabretensis]|uniref:hypothetical protein n=1 Tax=Terracidiphilus gabretensis TaxID=1577687 RepID=UPI00071B3E72|nr:hypothetical protein [Terracidiphilus gabretensis]